MWVTPLALQALLNSILTLKRNNYTISSSLTLSTVSQPPWNSTRTVDSMSDYTPQAFLNQKSNDSFCFDSNATHITFILPEVSLSDLPKGPKVSFHPSDLWTCPWLGVSHSAEQTNRSGNKNNV